MLVDNLGERGAHLVAVNLLRAAIRREEDAKADAAATDAAAADAAQAIFDAKFSGAPAAERPQ